MKNFPILLLLIGLSTGFFAAWIASIADYRIENRVEATKATVEFSELDPRYRDGEQLLEIRNLPTTPEVEIGENVTLKFDGRLFEFCAVKRGSRTFTFSRERTRKTIDLSTILKSDSFEARTAASNRVSWEIGEDRFDQLLEQHDDISRSHIVLLNHQRNSCLWQSSVALVCYWGLAITFYILVRPKYQSNEYWKQQANNNHAVELAQFPAAMSLVGNDPNSTCSRPLDHGVLPLTEATRRCRQTVPSLLMLSTLLSYNIWTVPLIHSAAAIAHSQHTGGLNFSQFCKHVLGSYVGIVFIALILIPMVLTWLRISNPIYGFWPLKWKRLTKRTSRKWSKPYLQFHEKLLSDLGFSAFGDFSEPNRQTELAFFVSPSKRLLVSLGVCSGNTGYQIYSVLSNSNLVQTCCWLDSSDTRRIESQLDGGKFVHQESDHHRFLAALEAHEVLLQSQCSETVLEFEFHTKNVIRFIKPEDMASEYQNASSGKSRTKKSEPNPLEPILG